MEQTEKLVELSEEDIAALKAGKSTLGGLIVFIPFIILAVISLVALIIDFRSLEVTSLGTVTEKSFVILGFLIGIILACLVLKSSYTDNQLIEKDIAEGKKKTLIVQIVEKQKVKSRRYIQLKSASSINEYKVSRDDYSRYLLNTFVEIHLAQPSGKLLRILPVNEESESIVKIS